MVCHGLTDASSRGDTLEIYPTKYSVNGSTELEKLTKHGINHAKHAYW